MRTRRLAILVAAGCFGMAAAAQPPPPVEVPPWESHGFSVVAADPPRIAFAGQTVYRRVTFRNDGSLTWRPGDGFRLSYHWRDRRGAIAEFEGERTELPGPVPSGASIEVALRVLMPERAGRYAWEPDVVQERVRWVSLTDPTRTAPYRVLVLPDWAVAVGGILPAVVALAGVLVAGRRFPTDRLARLAAGAWLGVGLLAKPTFLYAAMSTSPESPSRWLGAFTVATLCLLLAPLPRRVLAVLAWALAAAASVFIWADILYFRFFDDLISVGALQATGNLRDLGGAVQELARTSDAFLFLDLPIGLVLAARLARNTAAPSPRRRWALGLATLTLAAGIAVRLRDPRPTPRNEVRTTLLERLGLWPFTAEEALAAVFEAAQPSDLGPADRAQLDELFAESRERRAGQAPWFGVARDRNLLLLQVESMQGFVVGLTVEGQEVTPHLNRLAREALYYPTFFDQTGAGRSSAGDFVAQTSLVPAAASIAYAAPGKPFDTIASTLAASGYTTLSAVPFRSSFWNRRLTHPTYGYATSLFRDDFAEGVRVGWGLNDREFFQQMQPRLAALPQPWCAWLTTLSLHFPYQEFPEALEVLELGALEGTPMGNYLHGMHLFDRALGELLDGLAAAGLLDSTVIAVWGDHDAGLTWERERGTTDRRRGWGRSVASRIVGTDDAGLTWERERGTTDPRREKVRRRFLDRVPFVVRVPGSQAPRGHEELPAGHLDIAPTLVALFGMDPGPIAWQGRNLLGAPGDDPIVHPGGSWVTRRHLRMDDGSCWSVRDLTELPPASCAGENLIAERQLWVARQTVRYGLQRELSEALAALSHN